MSKHDGKLDKDGKVHVHFDDDIPFEDGCVHLANSWGGGMSLCADEALSLLEWLEQERTCLEQLAKEEPTPNILGGPHGDELYSLPEGTHIYPSIHLDGKLIADEIKKMSEERQ